MFKSNVKIFNEEIKVSTVYMCLQRLYSQDVILERVKTTFNALMIIVNDKLL